MDYSPIFTYNFANMDFGNISVLSSLTWIGIEIAIIILLYILSLFVWHIAKWIQDSKSKKQKAKVLQDLILMKDIQSEIEKEIEQARLKAAFQD